MSLVGLCRRNTRAGLLVLLGLFSLCCGNDADEKSEFNSGVGADEGAGGGAVLATGGSGAVLATGGSGAVLATGGSGAALATGGDATVSGTGGSNGLETGEQCGTETMTMPAATVVSFVDVEQPSSGSGGVVLPGEYVLSGWTQYRTTELDLTERGAKLSGVMILSEDGSGRRILNWDGEVERSSFDWETAAGYLGFTFRCPSVVEDEIEANFYSVNSDTLTLLNDNMEAWIFVRR